MRPLLTALLCCTLSLVTVTTRAAEPAALQPITRLDLPRYMGTWYEIARYPAWFQKSCAGGARADYHLGPQGVQVLNRCRQQDGSTRYAAALGRQLGAADSARLEVSFAPRWLAFLPLVWGDYWVIDLDPDYQLAAVSEPGRDYLWILARTPQVDPQAYAALLQRLQAMGFDPQRLIRPPQ